MTTRLFLQHLETSLGTVSAYEIYGKITDIHGMSVIGSADHNDICIASKVTILKNNTAFQGEVVALKDKKATILLATPISGLSIGDRIHYHKSTHSIAPCEEWLGRTLDAFAMPIDAKGHLIKGPYLISTKARPLSATQRQKVYQPIDLGVRALNAFVPACKGQRLGIFAGSGIGKSVLLSMLARNTLCDVCIIGLIGERSREVREFIEDTLGPKGLRKSILVVATSNDPPLARRQAAYTTLAIAEYFRDRGLNVLCIIDSLTRFAMAQREIGLSAGEPPTTKGYPPSTFFELAQLCERAGPGLEGSGTITAFFSVLVDGDDPNEPISDTLRGILDGHIFLDRSLAERGQYPAINVLKSISRLTSVALDDRQKRMMTEAKKLLSIYDDMADLIRLGAFQPGSNADVDRAIQLHSPFVAFLRQSPHEVTSFDDTFLMLQHVIEK